MSEHQVLSLEALESSIVPEEWVAVPEYGEGMEVLVRGLTPEELFRLNQDAERHAGDASYGNARLLAVGVKEPKWSAEQWRKAESRLAAPYVRLLQAVQRLSGLEAGAADAAQKNSLTPQG